VDSGVYNLGTNITSQFFYGSTNLKYIGIIIGTGIAALSLFVLVVIAFPDAFRNRVDTWKNRIENFTSDKPGEDDYQIKNAKIAIASGGLYGLGPGKSVQKNFLPQSSSDFIFAIIVEEYGLIGSLSILGLYLLLLTRFVIAAHKANSLFGKLLVVGLGFPIVFQALINMAVAVELLPVTGQTLPLISSGGSSIWMTCIAIGIILSVTKKEEEVAQELEEKQKREEALQKLIDKQLQEDEEENEIEEDDFSITENPLKAVQNKK
jgi:cell division protein FtsW